MIALVASVLAASVIGSPHCAGMCGGFVCFVSGQDRERRWLTQFSYHGGRLLSYVGLGVVAGALGSGLDHAGATRGLSHVAAFASGLVLLLWGGATLAHALGARLPGPRLSTHKPIAAVMRRLAGFPPPVRALAIGVLTTLLPCGWLYLFVATAGGTGSPAWGALVMAVFWIGTVPILLGLGALAHTALAPVARRLPLVSSSVLIVLGLLTLAGKFHGGTMHHHGAQVSVRDHVHD